MLFHDHGVVVSRPGFSRNICYPGILLCLLFWLKENYDLLPNVMIYFYVASAFLGFNNFCCH